MGVTVRLALLLVAAFSHSGSALAPSRSALANTELSRRSWGASAAAALATTSVVLQPAIAEDMSKTVSGVQYYDVKVGADTDKAIGPKSQVCSEMFLYLGW